ncbi:MAG: DNA/RNA nuclease SfsA [Hyphomicrobiaceae bacterium]|nr:DNA/RNA nuclease SfsA [Hyphomicrobiaceae bacterium]
MQFQTPLLRGRLQRRYKRFLADVELDSGETITCTCPNTGSMIGLVTPGAAVWLSESDSPTRKYRHTWELVEHDLGKGPAIVGINTNHPNKLVSEAIEQGRIAPLKGYASLRREVKYGKNSRIDILLEDEKKGACYVEIKNVHMMRRHGLAEFPDSVTARGAKHLAELADMVAAGHRAVMMFLIQRGDAAKLSLARDIDATYGEAFEAAVTAGVEVLAYRCTVTPEGIEVDRKIPVNA